MFDALARQPGWAAADLSSLRILGLRRRRVPPPLLAT